jgi:hypothetical protein
MSRLVTTRHSGGQLINKISRGRISRALFAVELALLVAVAIEALPLFIGALRYTIFVHIAGQTTLNGFGILLMMLLLVTPIALFFVVLDAFQAGEIRAIAHLRKLTWVALAGALAASAWIAYSVLYEGPSEMHVSNAVILTPFLFLWLPLIHIWFVRNDELA